MKRRDFIACFHLENRLLLETARMTADEVRMEVLANLRGAHPAIEVTVYRSDRVVRMCDRASRDDARRWALRE